MTADPGTGRVWDLVVVGAGPAGTATALSALHADPGMAVLLLDRADFPRDKSCGDGIAPHVFDALASIGVTDVADGWTPVRHLELHRGDASVGRSMSRPTWVIPRQVFDAALVDRATAAGAVLRRQRVRTLRRSRDEVVLDERIRARVVVGADGAHSVVRSAVSQRPVRRRALAIRGYSPTPPDRRAKQLIVYGSRRQPSYAWAFDRGDGLSNVGYGELLSHGSVPSRSVLLDQLERLLPGTVPEGTQWRGHHLPLSDWRWTQPDGRVLLVGDAGGLVNPMTGAGIYYAVATGIAAGRVAATPNGGADAGADPGSRHRRSVQALLARHLRHTAVTSRVCEVPAFVDAGLRAAARDQRVFDDLVEIGLGRGHVTARLLGSLAANLVVRHHEPSAMSAR
jgi:menaquinone-9 beta-reductase